MKTTTLIITIFTEEQTANRFRYLVSKDGKSYQTFNTEQGFINFLQLINLNLAHTNTIISPSRGEIKHYKATGIIHESTFKSLSDLPENTIKHTALVNGKYVTCYYEHIDEGVIIYKPHHSSKEVYQPLSLEDSLEFAKQYG